MLVNYEDTHTVFRVKRRKNLKKSSRSGKKNSTPLKS